MNEKLENMSQKIYQVYSPDGFSIYDEKTFNSEEEAIRNYDEWAKRFIKQGYYSSNNGRIPLDELKENCTFKDLDKGNHEPHQLRYLNS